MSVNNNNKSTVLANEGAQVLITQPTNPNDVAGYEQYAKHHTYIAKKDILTELLDIKSDIKFGYNGNKRSVYFEFHLKDFNQKKRIKSFLYCRNVIGNPDYPKKLNNKQSIRFNKDDEDSPLWNSCVSLGVDIHAKENKPLLDNWTGTYIVVGSASDAAVVYRSILKPYTIKVIDSKRKTVRQQYLPAIVVLCGAEGAVQSVAKNVVAKIANHKARIIVVTDNDGPGLGFAEGDYPFVIPPKPFNDMWDLYSEKGHEAVLKALRSPTDLFEFHLNYGGELGKQYAEEKYKLSKLVSTPIVSYEQFKEHSNPNVPASFHKEIVSALEDKLLIQEKQHPKFLQMSSYKNTKHLYKAKMEKLTQEDFKSSNCFIDHRWMSYGKTRGIGIPFVKLSQKEKGYSVYSPRTLIISPTQALSLESNNVLKKEKVKAVHYNGPPIATSAIPNVKILTICTPSLIKKHWEYFISKAFYIHIDELSEHLELLASEIGAKKPSIYYKFCEIILRAYKQGKLLMSDANMSDCDIIFLKTVIPEFQFTKIQVPENDQLTKKQVLRTYGAKQFGMLESEMQSMILMNEAFIVACESSSKAHRIKKNLLKLFPSLKVLLVTADTSDKPEYEKFFNNPSRYSIRFQVLIYSPSVSSGVSITHKKEHFKKVFYIGSGHVKTAKGAAQMMGRCRYVNHWWVHLEKASSERGYDAQLALMGLKGLAVIHGEGFDASKYDSFHQWHKANREKQLSNFAGQLCWLFESYGWDQFKAIDYKSEANLTLDLLFKELNSNEEKEIKVKDIMESKDITSAFAHDLLMNKSLSEEEENILAKHTIKTTFNLTNDNLTKEIILEYLKGGLLFRVNNFIAAYFKEYFTEPDNMQHLTLRRNHKAICVVVDALFSCDDYFTYEDAQTFDESIVIHANNIHATFSFMCEEENRILLASAGLLPSKYLVRDWKPDPYNPKRQIRGFKTPKSPIDEVKAFYEKLGLRMVRDRVTRSQATSKDDYRRYCKVVDKDHFQLMVYLATKRKSKFKTEVLKKEPPVF